MVRRISVGDEITLRKCEDEEKVTEVLKVVKLYTHHVLTRTKTGFMRCVCNGDLLIHGYATQEDVILENGRRTARLWYTRANAEH